MKPLTPQLLLILLFSLGAAGLAAQLRPRYPSLQNNFQNINPAAINHLNISRLVNDPLLIASLQHQSQDVDGQKGINGTMGSVEYLNPELNSFFSASLSQENVHIHKTTRAGGNFSYQVDLDDRGSSKKNLSYLSLGLGYAANFLSTDLNSLRYADQSDQVRPLSSSSYSTVSGGIFYIRKRYRKPTFYGGFSGHHNFGPQISPSTQFYLISGVIIPTKNLALLIEPNVTVRYADHDGLLLNTFTASPVSLDAGCRLWYDTHGPFGVFAGGNYGLSNKRAQFEFGFSFLSKSLGEKRPKITRSAQQRRNRNSSNAPRIGYTYDVNIMGDFKTGDIQSIFLIMPFSFGK